MPTNLRDERDKFSENDNSPWLKQDETENMKSPIK